MSGHRGRRPSSAGAPRHRGLHQLLLIIAGATLGFVAIVHVGVPAMLVVLAAAGWAAAQYDDVYRRAHPDAPPAEGNAMERTDRQRDDDVIIDLRERLAPYDDAASAHHPRARRSESGHQRLEHQRRL